MATNKIVCPRCFSKKLYKFSKNKNGYQKYQCRDYRRQFAPEAPSANRVYKSYPKYPICEKVLFYIMITYIIQISDVVMKCVIIQALTLYFLLDSSTRRISQFLFQMLNIKVSHMTITSWTRKFAPLFKLKSDSIITIYEINGLSQPIGPFSKIT